MIGMKHHDYDEPSGKPVAIDRLKDLADGSSAITVNEGQRVAREALQAREAVTWRPADEVPQQPQGSARAYIVAVRRKHSGKVWCKGGCARHFTMVGGAPQ